MNENWSFKDFEGKYFISLPRIGKTDALYKISSLNLKSASVSAISEEFHSNFKSILEAAAVPFYVALFAASMSQAKLIEDLLKEAQKGYRDNFSVAMFLMNNESHLKGIESVVPTFESLEEHRLLTEQFEVLYKIIAISFYGCLESLSKSLLKCLILDDTSRLDQLHAQGLKVGKSNCQTLKARLSQTQNQDGLNLSEAYDDNILNKGYSFEQYTFIFSCLCGFSCSNRICTNLKTLESSRHLIVHRNSEIDQKYIDETGINAAIGDKLQVSSIDMYAWQDSIIEYASNLIKSVDCTCS
jgi:hypothetical protein